MPRFRSFAFGFPAFACGFPAFAFATVLLAFVSGCKPTGRSVRAWIESRDPRGAIVAGATVEVDGLALGLTDPRGQFRLKLRRDVGTRVEIAVVDERPGAPSPAPQWRGWFTVGTNGAPVEHAGGRIVAVLGLPEAPSP